MTSRSTPRRATGRRLITTSTSRRGKMKYSNLIISNLRTSEPQKTLISEQHVCSSSMPPRRCSRRRKPSSPACKFQWEQWRGPAPRLSGSGHRREPVGDHLLEHRDRWDTTAGTLTTALSTLFAKEVRARTVLCPKPDWCWLAMEIFTGRHE